jgi:HK97 family phage major capsid protein
LSGHRSEHLKDESKMAKSAKQLREERAPLALKIKEMADLLQSENRDFTSEETQNWESVNKDYNLLTSQIEARERAEKIEVISDEQRRQADEIGREDRSHKPDQIPGERVETRGPTDSDLCTALQGWCRVSYDMPLEARHITACERMGQNPRSKEFTVNLRHDYNAFRRENRVQVGVTDTAGGFLRPEGFVANLERALLAYGGVRNVADVMRTGDGNDMPWPTSDDTSNEAIIIGEQTPTTAPEQDATFGQVIFRAHLYSSKLIRVSSSLLQDSAFPLATVVPDILGERIGRGTSRHYTTGIGGGQPRGVVTAATTGKTTATATAITFDEVYDLIHSVDPAYRDRASFMLHDNVVLYVRKLKDGNGNYLWQPSNQAGVPDRLAGYPLTVNQHMASSVATGAITMLFGDFGKYKIRDVADIRFRRLDERYAELDQVGFVAFFRTDGNLLNAGTGPVKSMVQA